jgi:hypothetical protein
LIAGLRQALIVGAHGQLASAAIIYNFGIESLASFIWHALFFNVSFSISLGIF